MSQQITQASFHLSDKHDVTLRLQTATDIESLDKWLRQTYTQQASETVKLLPDTVQKQFMLDVLDKAMMLSSQFGDGRSMLFANIYGTARFVYSHLAEQNTLTFERFHDILFPEGFLLESGQIALGEMLRLIYGDEIDNAIRSETPEPAEPAQENQ
jgi:hypothetical protein